MDLHHTSVRSSTATHCFDDRVACACALVQQSESLHSTLINVQILQVGFISSYLGASTVSVTKLCVQPMLVIYASANHRYIKLHLEHDNISTICVVSCSCYVYMKWLSCQQVKDGGGWIFFNDVAVYVVTKLNVFGHMFIIFSDHVCGNPMGYFQQDVRAICCQKNMFSMRLQRKE